MHSTQQLASSPSFSPLWLRCFGFEDLCVSADFIGTNSLFNSDKGPLKETTHRCIFFLRKTLSTAIAIYSKPAQAFGNPRL